MPPSASYAASSVDVMPSVNTPDSTVGSAGDLDQLTADTLPVTGDALSEVDVVVLVDTPLGPALAGRDVDESSGGSSPAEVLTAPGFGDDLLNWLNRLGLVLASLVTLLYGVVTPLLGCSMQSTSTTPVPS